jgi:hypothetical protein
MKLKRHFLFPMMTCFLIAGFTVPIVTLLSCKSTVKVKEITEAKAEEAVTHHFSPVRCSRKEGDIVISVSVVYRGQDKGSELTERSEELIGIIRSFGSSISDNDLTDLSRYQGSHEKLKIMFNKILKNGKVETVVFRSIGKQ